MVIDEFDKSLLFALHCFAPDKIHKQLTHYQAVSTVLLR